MNIKISRLREQGGMTLIELAVGVFVTMVLIASTLPFFKLTLDSYSEVHKGKFIFQGARIALTRMVSEIRTITTPEDVLEGWSDEIDFNHPSGDRICYALDANTIIRGTFLTDWNWSTLLENVNSLDFEYYDKNGGTITAPFYTNDDLRRIRMEVDLDIDGEEVAYVTQIAPRQW